jgi:glycosyltransferase involved in cell wall biosynthesis
MKVAFTTNLCARYNVKTFELLSTYHAVDFFFFSAGEEWYWQQRHGVENGQFKYQYLPGFKLGQTRVTLSLPWKLLLGRYDVYLKCISGRFAVPVTYLISRIKRKPFILWTGVWTRIQTPFHRLFFPVTHYIYTHADAVVVYGDHVKRYLVSEGVDPSRIFVAYHAADNDFYSQIIAEKEKQTLREKLNIASDQKVVLYLGRLEEIKGLGYLLDAFAGLNNENAVLVLAGDGSELLNLQRRVKELGIEDRVRFAGYVPATYAPQFYSLAWVFVLPSITVPSGKETWGLVLNEAMNQGVPVIATDAVGAAAGGLVRDQINGFIVPEKDVPGLNMALEKILGDETLHAEMSKNALLEVSMWTYQRNVNGYLQAIDDVTHR